MRTRCGTSKSNNNLCSLVIAAFFVVSLSSAIQGETQQLSDDLEYGVRAKLTTSVPPSYPAIELRRGLEGWVILNFVVRTDGSIADPIIEDSSGSRYFEAAALQTVSDWQYAPATWNGDPVEQCHTNVRVTFAIDGNSTRGATQRFTRRYKRFLKYLNENELEEAEKLIEEIFEHDQLNLYEMSIAWLMRSSLAEKRGDLVGELRALRKASVSEGKWMEPDRYHAVRTKIFWLEIETEQFSDSLASYRQLQESPDGPTDSVVQVAEQIVAQVGGPAVFGSKAVIAADFEVEEAPYWRHEPLRRTVGIQDIDGSVDRLEIRCDWNRASDTVHDGKTWTIPESWGDCRIFVFGEEGAGFMFVEYPDEPRTSGLPSLDQDPATMFAYRSR